MPGLRWTTKDRRKIHELFQSTEIEKKLEGINESRRMGLKGTKPLLVKMLQDPKPRIRKDALHALNCLLKAFDASTTREVRKRLKDSDAEVRAYAVFVLAHKAKKLEAARLIRPLLEDPDQKVSEVARREVKRLSSNSWVGPRIVPS